MLDYIIIAANFFQDLQEEVNNFLQSHSDYELLGGIACDSNGYYQAVKKSQPSIPKSKMLHG